MAREPSIDAVEFTFTLTCQLSGTAASAILSGLKFRVKIGSEYISVNINGIDSNNQYE